MQKFLRLFWEAVQGKEKDFTTGSIDRAIFLLAVPMIMEMGMESLFSIIDIYFVASLGSAATTAVGITEAVMSVVYAIAVGISVAATALVARRVGEKKWRNAAEAAVQAIIIGLVVAFILGLTGLFFSRRILELMNAEASVIEQGFRYTQIVLGSNIVVVLLFLLNGIFRGAGDASLAMYALVLANGLNIVLDPLLIFGIGPFPELGVTGAAIATVIGRSTGVAFQLFILFGGHGLVKIRWQDFRVDRVIIKRLARLSATGAGQFLIGSASWILLLWIIGHFGKEATAGYTIAIRLIIFTILPSWGVAMAASTLVGQNLGAGQPERAERSVWRSAFINMLFLLLVSVVYFFNAEAIVRVFDSTPEVVRAGVLSLRIICLGYIFFAYGMVLSQAFNGAGDTRTPTIINFFCFWMLEIPLAYTLALIFGWGLAGVCWAIAISETTLAIVAILWFRRGNWRTVEI